MIQPTTVRVLPDAERIEEELLRGLLPGQVHLGPGDLSFADFVELLAGAARLGKRPADSLTARALLAACALRVPMGPFAKVRGEAGFVRAVEELFSALKAGCCRADELTRAAARFPEPRQPRAQALARLYKAYCEALAENGLADAGDALLGAAERLDDPKAPLPPLLQGAKTALFEDIYDWPPARLELLIALGRRFHREGKGQRVVLRLPYDRSRPELMAFVEPVWSAIEKGTPEQCSLEVVAKEYADLGHDAAGIARALFLPAETPLPPTPSSAGAERGLRQVDFAQKTSGSGVCVVVAESPAQEVREVARRIRDLIDAGEAPESIAVAIRRPADLGDRMAEALEEYGVPARLRRGLPLTEAPPVRLALGLPELAASGFERQGLAALLGSRYVRLGAGGAHVRMLWACGARDDRTGVPGGKGGYALRLEALARRKEGQDREAAQLARATLEAVRRAMSALGRIPSEGTFEAMCRGMRAALESLGLLSAVRALEEGELGGDAIGQASLRAMARDQAALDDLLALLDELPRAMALAGRGREKWDREEFGRLLADGAADRVLAPRGPRGGAVRILDVRELVGRCFAHLFIVDLVDGRFPARPQPHPLFPDEDRLLLNRELGRPVFRVPRRTEADLALPARQAEEPMLFFLALCAAERSLTLSASNNDSGGRAQVRSAFFEEVLRLVGPQRLDQARGGAIPRLGQCRSRGELLARVALEVLADPALAPGEARPGKEAGAVHDALDAGPHSVRLRRIERLAAIEQERFEFFSHPEAPPGPHTGFVGGAGLDSWLEQRYTFDAARPASPSLLSEHGTCGFKAFLGRALNLSEEEEPGEEIDQKGQGRLQHEALHLFFDRMRQEGRLPLRGRPEEREALEKALVEAARAVEREEHTGHPALWALKKGEAASNLTRLLSREASEPLFEGMLPSAFEVKIGEGDLPMLAVPGPRNEASVYLGGRVDRIDASGSGAAVIDYKSGKLDGLKKRLKNELLKTEFQLPLYLAVLRAARPEAKELDAAYVSLRESELVSLRSQNKLDVEALLELDPKAREALRAHDKPPPNLADEVWRLVSAMREGRFPIRPLSCDHCDFASVCRIGMPAIEAEDEE